MKSDSIRQAKVNKGPVDGPPRTSTKTDPRPQATTNGAWGSQPTSRAAARAAGMEPPNRPGSFAIERELTTTVQRNGRDIRVVVEIPEKVKNAPVVLFLPGFKLDAEQYDKTTKYLASHGFVVARVDPDDDFLDWDHQEMSLDASAALDWLTSTGELSGRINPKAVGIAGHSLGGKLATMTALRDERIKGVFAIDPVNQRKPDVLAPGQIDNLKVPLGIVGQTTDIKKGLLRPATTPEGANFQAFFEKSKGPNCFALTIPNADHFDFTDEKSMLEYVATHGGTAEREDVLQVMRTALTGFFRQHLKNEPVDLRQHLPADAPWQQR
jgi:predicted dienelactone hydrolase